MDCQVDERQNDDSSQTDGGRVDGQPQNSTRQQEHAEHGEIEGFINFQDKITDNECNSSYYEAPIHPHAHRISLLRGKFEHTESPCSLRRNKLISVWVSRRLSRFSERAYRLLRVGGATC